MKRKDYFISYAAKDSRYAYQLKKYIESQGLSVWIDVDEITAGTGFAALISGAIRSCDDMFVLFSQYSIQSKFVMEELNHAISTAENRNKKIFLLFLDESSGISFQGLSPILKTYPSFYVDTSDSSWPEMLFPVLYQKKMEGKKALIYEEISELKKSELYLDASGKTTEIIEIILEQIQPSVSLRSQHLLIFELFICLAQLHDLYDHCCLDYSKEARDVTKSKLNMLKQLNKAFGQANADMSDIFYVCTMLRFLYWDREIRWDCADMITHGDMQTGSSMITLPTSEYAEKQKEFREAYIQTGLTSLDEGSEITTFVKETQKYIYWTSVPESKRHVAVKPKKTIPAKLNKKLKAIAGYINEGNRLFETIGCDEKSAAFIRCLITSYERLKNYCQEIGASDLTVECVKRIASLKERVQQYVDSEQKEHSTAENGIRALLGFSRPGTGNYDVFLSHRGYDTDIARNVYLFLKSRSREVFFDDVSLSEELSDTDYKNAIYQALDKARHFVVIITDLDELAPGYQRHEKDWMQEEMDVFHSEWIEGRKKDGNFVIIVTEDVYQKIVDANKCNIDLKWRRPTLIRLGAYQDQIAGYITNPSNTTNPE